MELPPEVRDHVDLEALSVWMAETGLGREPITEAVPLTGGTQNILLRIVQGERTYVFRRTPPNPRSVSNAVMRREARVLGALADTRVPHPRLIAHEPDETRLGCVFLLMELIEGFNPVEPHAARPDDAAWHNRLGFSYIEALAELAEVDVATVGLADFGKPDGFLERQVPLWLSHLERYETVKRWPGPDSLPGVARIADWLSQYRPDDALPGLLHGDCHLGNVMVRHDTPEIAALIDWEMSTVGDPRLDLGWVIATWPGAEDTIGMGIGLDDGLPPIDRLVAHYAQRTSRPIDAAQWFGVLACFKLGILLEGTHVRAFEGKAHAVVGDRLHGMAVRLFERALRMAT